MEVFRFDLTLFPKQSVTPHVVAVPRIQLQVVVVVLQDLTC